jgi:hypothetical protein
MTKQLLGMVAVLGVLGFVGARPALAQSDAMAIKVPFPFVVGGATLPAGTYLMRADIRHPDLVLLTSKNGRNDAELYTVFTDQPASTNQASFEFKKIEGQYYLSAIDIPGDNTREVALPEPEPAPVHHIS